MKQLWRVVVCGLFIVLIGCSDSAKQFITVMDVGSTGTRIHVFEVQQRSKPIPSFREILSVHTNPGLATLINEPAKIQQVVQLLLQQAEQAVAQSGGLVLNTPLYVLATAGVRQLPKPQQQQLLATLKHLASKQTEMPITKLQTITGQQEALFDWLAVNADLNALRTPAKQAVALDMGGASTEIAFRVEAKSQSKDIVPVTIDGETAYIFAKSFPGLGDKVAFRRMHVKTCYPKGYRIGRRMGKFNFTDCYQHAKALVTARHVAPQISARLKQYLQQHTIIAFSGFYYIASFFDVLQQQPLLQQLQQHVITECSKPWKDIEAEHPGERLEHLSKSCFAGTYIITLLHDGYGLPLDSTALSVQQQLQHRPIDWARGAALYYTLETQHG